MDNSDNRGFCVCEQVFRVCIVLEEATLAMPRFEVELLLVDHLSGDMYTHTLHLSGDTHTHTSSLW